MEKSRWSPSAATVHHTFTRVVPQLLGSSSSHPSRVVHHHGMRQRFFFSLSERAFVLTIDGGFFHSATVEGEGTAGTIEGLEGWQII